MEMLLFVRLTLEFCKNEKAQFFTTREIMSLHLTFKASGSPNFELAFDSSTTIGDVKAKCVEASGIDKDQQKIIFKGMDFIAL